MKKSFQSALLTTHKIATQFNTKLSAIIIFSLIATKLLVAKLTIQRKTPV